jgi:hypothetical protein
MPPDAHRAPTSTREWARVLGSIELATAARGEDVVQYGSADRDPVPAPSRPTGDPESIENLIHW